MGPYHFQVLCTTPPLGSIADFGDRQWHAIHHGQQRAAEDANGVAAAAMNVDARMAACQTRDLDAPRLAGWGGATLDLAPGHRVDAAGAADADRESTRLNSSHL